MKINLLKILSLLLCLTFVGSLFAVAGCDQDAGEESKFEIKENNPLPDIEPYRVFNMYSAFSKQEGVEYSFEGYYVNDKEIVKDIVFDGATFVISADNAVFANVTITGKKGAETAIKELSFDVKGEPDVVDNGYADLWCEPNISKTISYNPKYIKDGNSSVKVSFSGYYNTYGTQFANLMGHLCTVDGGIYDTDYFSIYKEADQNKAWEDAVMTFWVYYSGAPKGHEDAALEMGFRFSHINSAQLPAGARRDYDFGDVPIIDCELNEWKQIAIRFKDLHKTTPLELNFEKYKSGWTSNDEVLEMCDCVNFKCRLSHEDYESMDVKYMYSFYFDAIDILTYADFIKKYPDYDFASDDGGKGFDYGDTIVDKFNIENWRNGNKGISFDYSFVSPEGEHPNDLLYFYQWKGEGYEWERLTEMVEIDFENMSASSGKIIDLGDGKFRYELMFEDVPINAVTGQEANGDETANIIWFQNYATRLLTGNYKEIDAYSE